MGKQKTCVVIVGPTASGKTALSLQLAKHYATAIISADSRQCYRELNIGVAKPSSFELNSVTHYFINSHSVHDEVNTALFEQYALAAIGEIFAEKDIAVIVGGTGLYIGAFCEGIDDVPAVDRQLRVQLRAEYETNGMPWLQEQVRAHDPLYYEKGEIQNPQRMLRALEVKRATGRSILEYHTSFKKMRDFNIVKIGVQLLREQVYSNINKRVDVMMEQGLLDEVRELRLLRELNALQTVGYAELFEYLDGAVSLETAVDNIKKHTRHYAKRQLTWFNRDEEVNWKHPGDWDGILQVIEENRYHDDNK